jgi:diaminohydroxyphosphoribosylaminopyrimidine deaminase/5-amino-6-(5-phosphoribosylamino)uracil reductase
MQLLGNEEINELLVESGATLAGAMLEKGLIDELIIYQAPHIMGDEARGLFHLPALEHMAERFALRFIDVRQVGSDIRIIAKPMPCC